MYLAVDIGATKVLVAAMTNDGEIVDQFKFPTPKTYPSLVSSFAKEITKLNTSDFRAAVVAVPGKLDREKGVGIAFGNRPWRNVPIRSDFEHLLNTPVIIENDAKLAALSEAYHIKNEFKKVLYVTISTGISAGLIVNGIIDHSLQDSEAGQMWFDHRGKLTQWEDFASGRAIVERYHKRASEIDDPKLWQIIAKDIAIGLLELVVVIQPEIIVLGGGVGSHFDKYKKPLLAELKKYEVPLAPIPPIVKAQHPEEAVVYGCYQLAKSLSL